MILINKDELVLMELMENFCIFFCYHKKLLIKIAKEFLILLMKCGIYSKNFKKYVLKQY